MAQNSQRVIQVLNYDGLLRNPFPYRNMSPERSITGSNQDLFFTIVEFSLDSVRRNKNNQITQANCRLSMIENRNPFQNITAIPKLDRPPRNPGCPEWKICCPRKFKKNCPETTKIPPVEPISEKQDRIAANNVDSIGKEQDQQAFLKRLQEQNKED